MTSTTAASQVFRARGGSLVGHRGLCGGTLAVWVLSLPLMAYAPISMAGKSVVLPYLLAIPLAFCALRLIRSSTRVSRATLLLVVWLAYLAANVALAGLTHGFAPKPLTQLANIIILVVTFLALRRILWPYSVSQLLGVRNLVILGALAVSPYVLYEFTALELSLPFRYDVFFRNANTYSVRMIPVRTPLLGSFQPSRVMGTAPEPSLLSGYLAVVLALLLPEVLGRLRTKYALSFGLVFLAFVLTFGRSGWFAFGVAVAYALIVRLNASSKCITVFAIVVGCAFLLVAISLQGLPHQVTVDADERWLGQRIGITFLTKQPLLGIGLGRYESTAHALEAFILPDPLLRGALSHTYSLYVQFGAETGLLGLGAFLAFVFSLWRRARTARLHARGSAEFRLAGGVECAIVAIACFWFIDQAYNLSIFWLVFALASVMPTAARPNACPVVRQQAGSVGLPPRCWANAES